MAVTRNMPRTWSERRDAIVRGLRDTRSELRKVTWPTRQETINLTLVVIALSVVLGLILGGVDLLVAEAFKWLAETWRTIRGV
ncbi:MAG: preprotein translocase subunit SecE [Chloroflexi bacterium]|nr:preprotein translocase subunit SecE [Chloroflexota bacterium]